MGMKNLSEKKMYLFWGGVLLGLFCTFQFIYLPTLNKRNDLKRLFKNEIESFQQIKKLQMKYMEVEKLNQNQNSLLKNRDKAFSLFSFLSTQAQQTGLKENVISIQPSTQTMDDTAYNISKVTVKISKIYLKPLIDFLSKIELSGMGLKISSLSLSKTGKKNEMFDAVIEIETLILKTVP
jgi:hypothetical protein